MHPEKGIALLIEAFRRAVDLGLAGWSLRLVGPADTAAGGGGLGWLQDLLSNPLASGYPIEWLGPIYSEQELLQQYQQASLFVYPSLAERGETFGLAPLEAMSCGSVPIVSNLSCFRDFITPGVNGSVFDHRSPDAGELLAHDFLTLASNPVKRSQMAEAALAVRHTHDPAAIARQFLDCFDSLLQRTPL
jgi:glycosyltransferase involved in cell wall biosynthesis